MDALEKKPNCRAGLKEAYLCHLVIYLVLIALMLGTSIVQSLRAKSSYDETSIRLINAGGQLLELQRLQDLRVARLQRLAEALSLQPYDQDIERQIIELFDGYLQISITFKNKLELLTRNFDQGNPRNHLSKLIDKNEELRSLSESVRSDWAFLEFSVHHQAFRKMVLAAAGIGDDLRSLEQQVQMEHRKTLEQHADDTILDERVLMALVVLTVLFALWSSWCFRRFVIEPVAQAADDIRLALQGIPLPVAHRQISWGEIGELSRDIQSVSDHIVRENELQCRFQAISKEIPEAMLILGKSNKIEWANPSAERLFGATVQSGLVGVYMTQVLPSWQTVEEFREICAKDGAASGRTLEGRNLELCLHCKAIETKNERQLLVIVDEAHSAIDVQSELRRIQRLESSVQLAVGIAHDINNILLVIKGAAELLENSGNHDRKQLGLISGAVERASLLTKRLRDYGHYEELKPTDIQLFALFQEVASLVKPVMADSIELNMDLMDSSLLAYADEHQLENALVNLCLNSRDAMPEGGRVSVTARRVSWPISMNGSTSMGNFIAISVSDTGIGMPTNVVDHVIEPFYTTKPKDVGSGLGLSMVYSFVTQSGGYMEIETGEDEGTRITLFLPSADQSRNDSLSEKE